MNQYQRMICYLYEYNKGQKGGNVGYVRLEQRGERCRVQIQMRGRNLEKPPVAAFFKQENTGINLLQIGDMQTGKGEMYCRVESNSNNLLGTDHTLEEMDGIFLYVSDALYFASSWKLQDIFLGSLTWWGQKPEREKGSEEIAENKAEAAVVQVENEWHKQTESDAVEKSVEEWERTEEDAPEEVAATSEEITQKEEVAATMQDTEREAPLSGERSMSAEELEAQTLCECCPFKRKELDFGKRMLLTFPVMKPFGGQFVGECVRIEPQDLGCLPMRLWPLSGNAFLMQGYYNYRHLIFMERSKGQYAIGVPGIYSDTMQEQGKAAGFTEFLAICGQRNCRGAFGYWLMLLSGK